jgi:hypothetical protein
MAQTGANTATHNLKTGVSLLPLHLQLFHTDGITVQFQIHRQENLIGSEY